MFVTKDMLIMEAFHKSDLFSKLHTVVLQTCLNYRFSAFFNKKLRRFVSFSRNALNRSAHESRDPGASFELYSVF